MPTIVFYHGMLWGVSDGVLLRFANQEMSEICWLSEIPARAPEIAKDYDEFSTSLNVDFWEMHCILRALGIQLHTASLPRPARNL